MLFDEFVCAVEGYFTALFEVLQEESTKTQIEKVDDQVTFPSICCATQFAHHYVAEFFGHSESFDGLRTFRRTATRERSVNEYLQQFDNPVQGMFKFTLGSFGSVIHGLLLSDADELDEGLKRLGMEQLQYGITGHVYTGNDPAGTIWCEQSGIGLTLIDSLILNSRSPVFRAKWMNLCVICSADATVNDLVDKIFLTLGRRLGPASNAPIKDALTGSSIRNIADRVRAQFTSLYLTDAIHETAIGEFFKNHPAILTAAIGGTDFKHELELPWQIGELPAIRPDVLVRREDGDWDICDLKTAVLLEKCLTTGGPARTRFKRVIHDGIAQLTHYEKYFEDKANAEFAKKEHGITVRNPSLFLAVGNRDNLPQGELLDALRNHPKNLQVLDYDTIATLYAIRGARNDVQEKEAK